MLSRIPTRLLGASGPRVSAIGLGTMGLGKHYGGTDESSALKALTYASNRGVTFWDTADIYDDVELTLGKWFEMTNRRNDIFLATKFGAMDPEGKFGGGKQCSEPQYVKYALQRSLARLQTSYVDLYYQHRVDPHVPIEVVMESLREPLESGQVKYIGLSECSVDVLRRAKSVEGVGEKLIACQMEFSPFELSIEKNGFTKVARELGVSVVAYGPLGRGMITGAYRSRADFDPADFRLRLPRFTDENFSKNLVLADKFKSLGQKLHSTPSQIALAWILAKFDNFVPIPGFQTIEHVEDNAVAAELHLKPEDVGAISRLVEEADVQGERITPEQEDFYQQDCITLDQWKGE